MESAGLVHDVPSAVRRDGETARDVLAWPVSTVVMYRRRTVEGVETAEQVEHVPRDRPRYQRHTARDILARPVRMVVLYRRSTVERVKSAEEVDDISPARGLIGSRASDDVLARPIRQIAARRRRPCVRMQAAGQVGDVVRGRGWRGRRVTTPHGNRRRAIAPNTPLLAVRRRCYPGQLAGRRGGVADRPGRAVPMLGEGLKHLVGLRVTYRPHVIRTSSRHTQEVCGVRLAGDWNRGRRP